MLSRPLDEGHQVIRHRALEGDARGGPLQGALTAPGDKSISHRALMLAALAVGETAITGLLEGDDVRHTAAALRFVELPLVNPTMRIRPKGAMQRIDSSKTSPPTGS